MVAYAFRKTAITFVVLALANIGASVPSATAQDHVPQRSTQDAGILKWLPWIAFGGTLHDRKRGEGELWAPLVQDSNSVLFTHLQGKLFDADAREGNIALGYRQKLSEQWVGGLWVGYDLRRSPLKHTFHQIAGGVEALSRNFDLRANWYLPINQSESTDFDAWTNTHVSTGTLAELSNDGLEIFTTETTVTTTGRRTVKEHALLGADAEIGVRLPIEALFGGGDSAPNWLDDHDVRVFAGGYYFDSKEFKDEIAGGRLRLEWNVTNILPEVHGSKLTLEADYQYDDVRKEQFEVGLRLRLPLGNHGWGNPVHKTLTYAERRMSDPIIRDTDVVTANFEEDSASHTHTQRRVVAREKAVDAVTGVRIDRVVTIDSDDDANSIIADAGHNSLIIATGSAGTFVNQGIKLLDQQTLLGAGTSLTLVGESSGLGTSFAPQGMRPTFNQTTDHAALTVDGNTHVTGIDITGGGKHGGHFNRGIVAAARNLNNIHIVNTRIRNMGGHGIRMHSGTQNWSVRNTSISDIWDGNGIDLENHNTFQIADTSISNIHRYSGDAIHMSAFNQGRITNTHFGTGITEHLIRFRNDNVITGSGNEVADDTPRFQFFGNNNRIVETLFDDGAGKAAGG